MTTTRIRVKSGSTSGYVDIKGPTAAELEAQVRAVLGKPLAILEREVRKVHQGILLTWPVKTGNSRSSFDVTLTLRPEQYAAEVSIVSDDPAVRFIKSTKQGRKILATRLRVPLQTEVRKPIGLIKKTNKAELDQAIRTALGQVLRGR